MNSLRSLDEEREEKLFKTRSPKQINHHLSNIFLNREEEVKDVIPKQSPSIKIININVPK